MDTDTRVSPASGQASTVSDQAAVHTASGQAAAQVQATSAQAVEQAASGQTAVRGQAHTGQTPAQTQTDGAAKVSEQPDEAVQSAVPAAPAPAFLPQPGQVVRMCVCGAPNPESARFCHRCGQDISDVMPMAYSGEPVSSTEAVAADAVSESAAEAFGGALLRLSSLDGLCALDVSESCVLGRGAVLAEYLADKPYVSRRQAYLTVENGRVYIVHGGGRNPTCLNNRPLREGAPEELHPGDEVALGGMTIDGERQTMAAYFQVRRAGGLGE